MSEYTKLCVKMDEAGGYMSDAIGKCQRDLRRPDSGPSRIDLYLAESETCAAFDRGDKLAARFDATRAVGAFLVWNEPKDWKNRVLPLPVSVDWASGILRQRSDDAYGLIVDVAHCLKQRDASGSFSPLKQPD
jgi:hypothetical protein